MAVLATEGTIGAANTVLAQGRQQGMATSAAILVKF